MPTRGQFGFSLQENVPVIERLLSLSVMGEKGDKAVEVIRIVSEFYRVAVKGIEARSNVMGVPPALPGRQ
jgi:hypothetical protein